MARENESTVSWKLDIADLKKGMQDARREISLANAEFKNATAGMGKWSDSATGVEAKIKQLTTQYKSQKQILADLKQQYAIVSQEMGETSPEAQRLKIQIENQEAAIKSTNAQIAGYSSKLAELKADEAAAETPMAKLNSTINEQESELADLKRQYADSIVGDNPTEAKRLATEIESLSGELAENKQKMADAENAANKLDKSVDDAGESAETAANGGFTVLKGALADLISDGIQRAMDFVSDLAGEAVASSDALKKFEGTMGFAGFDSSKIEEARASVKKYADDTVYDLDTIANTTAQLAANGVDDYNGLTQAAGNLNAVAGGNADTFGSVAMVMTQTAGAGKLTTENWNQLADAIPGASGKLQEALKNAGAYTGDFREAMSEGQITADEFNAAIMELGTDPIAVEAATSVSTFEGAMGNLEATVVSGLMDIYDQIGSENITGFITDITNDISDLIPYIQKAVQWVLDNKDGIIAALAGIAAGIAAMSAVQGIMGMIEAFKAWKTATEGMTIAQRLLNAAQMASPIPLVVGLIAGLVVALITLWNTNEDFRAKVIEIWGAVKEFVGNAIKAIANFFTVTLPAAIAVMVDWFKQLPGKIGGFVSQAWAKVKTWATNMATAAKNTGMKFLASIVAFFKQLPGKIGGFVSQAWAKVKTWATNMATSARNAGSKFLSNVISFIKQLPGKLWQYLKQGISKVAEWGSTLASKGKAAAKKLLDAVVNTIKQIPGKIASVGGNLVKGIWNGISNGLGWIKGKIRGWVGNVTKFIKSLFGIKSPSTVMRDQVGKYLAQGIGVGFGDEMPSVMRSMQRDMGGMVDGLRSDVSFAANGISGGGYAASAGAGGSTVAGGGVGVQNVNFYQTINSPSAVDRLAIYRDTKSILFTAKGGLQQHV